MTVGRRAALWPVVTVFLAALFVRAVYLYDSGDNPTFLAPVVDSATYDLIARELAEGWGMSREFFWQQFFYPFFLSLLYFISNSSIVFAKIVQVVFGSVTCVLVYGLGERLFGRKAGIWAGLIAAVYGPLVFFDAELLSAGWAVFWAAALLLLLVETAEKKTLRLCFALGLCAALSILTRPNFVPFLVAAGLWLVVVWIRSRAGIKKSTQALSVLAFGFCIVTMPVSIQNYRVTGRFGFLPATGGLNLYIGNNPDFEAVSLRPGMEWLEVVSLPAREGLRTPNEKQRFYHAKTLEYLREQPAGFLKGLARKSAEFTSSREIPGHIDIYMFRRWSPLLGLFVWKVHGFGFPFGVLLPLALLGMFFHRRKVPVPVWLFLVLYPASVILTHVEARYRMPVIVALCVPAGAALPAIVQWGRLKHWRNLAAAGIFCAGVAVLCSIAGPFYAEEHIDYDAELHYVLGGSLWERGLAAEGTQSYRKAISLKPDYLDAYRNLGLVLVEQRRLNEAAAHYNKAVSIFPEDAGLYEGLGLTLFEQAKFNEAVEQYRKALEIDPNLANIHDNLGRALFNLGQPSEARKHFSTALELNPEDSMAHNNMGSLLATQGDIEGAIEHYEISLKISPRNILALHNVAMAYAGQGEFEKAVASFKRALRITPYDPEIHFGLGHCLQRQGRIEEAVEAYKRVVDIQPHHRGANQALSELLRSRAR
ncbi:MAG: tetratricopeptide repeat protein [Planctomycetota bacterium]